jgi:hypothetical protein
MRPNPPHRLGLLPREFKKQKRNGRRSETAVALNDLGEEMFARLRPLHPAWKKEPPEQP